MKFEAPIRILSEDYPDEYQELIDKLAEGLNTYLDSLYNVLSNNSSIGDNLNQGIKTLKVTVDSGGKPVNSLKFSSGLREKVQGLQVIRALGSYYALSQPFIDFVDRDGIIEVNHIQGLEANVEYTLVIHIIGS